MPTLSVTIPDAIFVRVLNAVAYNNGYTDTITDISSGISIPNPMTKGQFCKNLVKTWVMNNVRTYESTKAADLARDAAIASVETEITIGD